MSKKNKKKNKDLHNTPMMNPEFIKIYLESSPSESIHWVVDMLNLFIRSKWKDDIAPIDLFLITKYISDAIPIMIADNLMDAGQDTYLEEGWNEFTSMSEEEIYESTGKLLELPIEV